MHFSKLSVLPLCAAATAMAIDLKPLWDFRDPAASEQRFRTALAAASGDDALILETQIARTRGLRRDFAGARATLAAIAPAVAAAGPEARARHALETGRTWLSATHPPEARTDEAVAAARTAYERAFEVARGAGLDGLAIDATHMLAFVDTAPADQLKWADAALALALASSQPAARSWEPSIRHNRGMALQDLGRRDEALAEFERALVLRRAGTDEGATGVARWMVAWTLRTLGRDEEALRQQLALERDADAAGAPSRYVYEELETLYRARGDGERADRYAAAKAALPD